MEHWPHRIIGNKIILRTRNRICENSEELLSSKLCYKVIRRSVTDLSRRNSPLLKIFDHRVITDEDVQLLVDTLKYLMKLSPDLIPRLLPGSEQFFRDLPLFDEFIEHLYNYWRNFLRIILCDSEGDRFDKRPYHTFNNTVEALTHLVRSTYRDLRDNITGNHPRIYRQVPAGAEIATIALPKPIPYPQPVYDKLNTIPVIRQILIYPPLIFNPPMNKRSGSFERVYVNPLESIDINKEDWLCYPAKVGSLMVMIYFSYKFAELGFALCNLFELSNDKDLYSKPDAAFLFGVPSRKYNVPGTEKTIFYDDAENDMLVGAIPDDDVFGYFGYLKKMTLTLHNIIMMKRGRFPFHGALVNLTVRGKKPLTILTIGDTGAGKSETLEAFRQIGGDEIENITVIADDMGSLFEMPDGRILGYGTETGAFIRLDDLQTGYAFGQIDRTIIMSPDEVNARAILPVTTYSTVIKGFPLDLILYANNYEVVGEENPVIEWFDSCDDALRVFREGYVMSKGTTAKTGMNQSYFANIFGPQQYQQEHDILADKYFTGFFSNGIKVGQLRTQLGIPGLEHSGPELAARALLELAKK